jgi:hypothetical protein
MNRRIFIAALAAPVGAALTLKASDVFAYDNPRRGVRPGSTVRRRVRRPVVVQTRLGRPVWVVPIGLAAGWELSHENRVVVVKETRIIGKDGAKSEVAIVQDASGKAEKVAITREDTADNSKILQGSVLDDNDTTTPSVVSAR